LGTSGCPIGLCPNGATCAQELGQWQCGCGLNGCPGSMLFIYSFLLVNKTIQNEASFTFKTSS